MTTSRPVLIVGGGIGGLVLGHALKNKSIPFRIFERDPFLDYRSQGYRFHLQPHGTDALFACIGPATLTALKQSAPYHRGIESGQAVEVQTGNVDTEMIKMAPRFKDGQKAFNVDRGSLRQVLSEELPLEFGKAFESYDVTSNGIDVHFHDGTIAEGSLLVGADGVRSQVRSKLLPDYTLLDTEGRWLWGKSELTPTLRSILLPGIATGIVGGRDYSVHSKLPVTLLAESIAFDRSHDNPRRDLLPPDYIYWVLQFSKRTINVEDAEFLSLDSNGAARLAQDLTKDWISGLRAILEHATPSTTAAQTVTSGDPLVPEYEGHGRITLLGDAIHQMSPSAGAGATSAILDAKWLADAVSEGGVTGESIARYEEKMRCNGREAIAGSEKKSAMMFGAPGFADMRRFKPDDTAGRHESRTLDTA